ncbi:MAG TPA: serine hydrolase [Saprospiraceae bacterium]|nr:serine hydrolase [Saprospiraceae bacterium]HPI07927.1 serine hydrolase [Saprospiraceae bacterium]
MKKSIFALPLFLFLLLSSALFSQNWIARHNLSSAQYQTEVNKWVNQGYRITQVSGYSDNGQDRYAAIFEQESGPSWTAKHDLTSAQYQAQFNSLTGQGYRPIQVSGFPSGNQAKFAAIFIKENNGPQWHARHNMTSAQYQEEFNEYVGQGYYLSDVSGYTVGGTDYYAAIWEKKAGAPQVFARHRMTSSEYQDEVNEKASQGYRLTKVSGYSIGNSARFAAIWVKTSGPALAARHALVGAQNYQDEFDRLYYQGYRPVWVNGYTVNNQDVYAGIFTCADPFKANELAAVDNLVQTYMQQNGVPGISIAIARNGKLVLVKTYGMADQEAGEKVAPRHKFRIASVSKPFTATAIMKLQQGNKIELGDKIFGPGSILGNTYGGAGAYTANLKKITVDHLLTHHAGGWDQDGDPISQNQDWNMTTYINTTLNNYPLDNAPGDVYDYSNFGYALLGRVIEKKTGQTYEQYVQDNVLEPCGITGMQIGGSTLAQRKPNEVKYYGGNAYTYNIPRMDAHGGWIASSIDLVRFLVHVDHSLTVPDILSLSTQTLMDTPSATNNSYCKGWMKTSSNSMWHNGALPSTLSEMKRTTDGFAFAILMNTRPGEGKDKNGVGMGQLLGDIKSTITKWPNHDLF